MPIGRHLRHPAVHAAGDDGRRRAVPGRPGRLAALARDLCRPDRRAHHRAARRVRRSIPMRSWRSCRCCSPPRAISSRAAWRRACRRSSSSPPRPPSSRWRASASRCSRPGMRPRPRPSLILLVASVALLAGQYWLIAAMRTGEIAVVAPFRYSIILWAIAGGLSRLAARCRTCHPGSASPSSRRPGSTPSCASSGWRGLHRA